MGIFGRKKGGGAKKAKVLFATDLHGSQLTFSKLIQVLELWSPDVLVLGGDVAGKGLVPVLVEGDRARMDWMGETIDVPVTEFEPWEEKVGQLGFYSTRGDSAHIERLREDHEFQGQVFEDLMVERWGDWLERLETRCAGLELPGFVIAGNDDPWALDPLTFEEREWVQGADGRVLDLLDDWSLLSIGLANQTPWDCPRDVSEEELASKLESLAAEVPEGRPVIANIHVPPMGSSLDSAPELDTSVDPPRPITGSTVSVGSTAVAEFIEKHQPMVSLHEHIHESPGAVTIGETRSYNPGSEFSEGILRAVLVTIEPDRVVGHQFVSG